jgi:hypothetical protein
MALVNIALIDATIGRDSKTISQNLNKARGIFNSSRHLIGTTLCDMVQADMELKEQQFHLVKFKLQECLQLSRGKSNELESMCLERLANIKMWPVLGSQNVWPVIFLGHSYKSKDKLPLHKALLLLGD